MQDNHMDEIWRDKLGGYQAPADPQDWADMAAMLDAKEEKRAGFFWWWMVAAALFVTVGGGLYHLTQLQNDNLDAFALSGETGGNDNPSNKSGNIANTGIDTDAANNDNETNNLPSKLNNNESPTADNSSSNGNDLSNNTRGNSSLNSGSNDDKPKAKFGKENKKSTRKTNSNVAINENGNGEANNGTTQANKGNTANNSSSTLSSNTASSATNSLNTNTGNVASDTYDKPIGTISVKRLKKLPNPLTLTTSNDTIKREWQDRLMKRRAVQHYLGLSIGWVHSRVDRSGDFRPGYNIGMQYTMMIKNRVGIHAGLAFRQYQYYTNLVACNYDLYQCPNSYSSAIQAIDLNIGAQVNLVKTDKVEWYVMGGVSNQFMLTESFNYNLPPIDTINPQPIPIEPPTTTNFTGPGASDYESFIDASLGTNGLATGSANGTGKFLRERYLGAWYMGTGVTWHFATRMNLQVEPVIGRSFQFVGIQDKKLWQTGVNVRMNVRLGR